MPFPPTPGTDPSGTQPGDIITINQTWMMLREGNISAQIYPFLTRSFYTVRAWEIAAECGTGSFEFRILVNGVKINDEPNFLVTAAAPVFSRLTSPGLLFMPIAINDQIEIDIVNEVTPTRDVLFSLHVLNDTVI